MPEQFEIFELVETKQANDGFYREGEMFRVLIPEGDGTIGRTGHAVCVRMKNLKETSAKESLEIPLTHLKELTATTVAKYLEDTKAPLVMQIKKAERGIRLINDYSKFLQLGRKERMKKALDAIREAVND